MKRNSHTSILKLALSLVFFVCLTGFSVAQRTVSGTILDADNGETLIGANVLIKGTSSGTVTDFDGKYSLNASDGDVLIFSYTGYAEQEIAVGSQSVINVSLAAGSLLDEVVVIGYGTAKRSDLTGSVSSVNEKDFNRGLVTSADQLIQGKATGVQVLNNSGQPGGATTVRIRGNASIRAGNNPLFVVDGVPLSGKSARPGLDAQGLGGSPSNNPLNFLNPSEIESIQVLKDASAAAIYGSRGANGVILITTKKGRSNVPKVEVSSSVGFSTVLNKYEVLDAAGYRAAIGSGIGDYGSDVDAFDAITRTAPTQNHSLSFSGGNDKGQYRMALGYFDQEGLLVGNDLRRINANINGSYKFLENDRLRFDVNIITSHTDENAPSVTTNAGFRGSLIGNALQWNPTHKLYESDGSPVIIPEFGDFTNPVALLEAYDDKANTFDVLASISPSFKITDNLTYKFLYSMNHSTGNRRASLQPWINLENVLGRGIGYLNQETNNSQILTHTLSLDTDIATDISLNAVIGYEYQKFREDGFGLSARDFPTTSIDFTNSIENGSASSRSVSSFAPPISELESYFGRAIFNISDKYLITATLRADGSSKFGDNNKFGYFPSLAGAWNISNEDFMSNGAFDNLRVRVGWGETGNSEFDAGASQERFALQENGATAQVNVANPDLKWETTTTFNVGVDFAVLDYKLTGSIDYFSKNSTDLLFQLPAIQPAPATFYWVNLDGEVANTGVEVALQGNLVDNANFTWDLGVNATFQSNEFKNYDGPNLQYGTLFGQGISGATIHRLAAGQPLNAFYVRDWQGINSEGVDDFLDASGNIVGATSDAFYLGNPNPDVLLGISTNLAMGDLSLGLNFNGAFGHEIYNNTKNTVIPIGNLGSRNIDASLVGNSVVESTANSVKSSSRYLEDGSYLKLANATLSYNLGNIGNFATGARVYLTGQNLLVFTNYSGFDPEVNTVNDANGLPSAGIEYIPYPSARTIIFGINFTL